jgi:hypothetical protein
MARTEKDVLMGRLMKWEIPGVRAHEGGFLLGDQIFCVQEGFASQRFIAAAARLFCRCFREKSSTQTERDFEIGGLSWDFIIAIFRGDDVTDIVAACSLVYGQSNDLGGRQFFYVFNVCTDPCVLRCGLASVLMGAVYRLCCMVERCRECDYWRRVLCFSDKLWLLLAVDLTCELVVPPEGLIGFYTKCGFKASRDYSIQIDPWECKYWRSIWAIMRDPKKRCQMWQEVLLGNQDLHRVVFSSKALAVLHGQSRMAVVALRFEQVLDCYFHLVIE